MEAETFPQQLPQPSKRIETPQRSTSLFEKVAGTYRSAKERIANLTKRAPREVPKSFSDAVALEAKIQEQIGRTILTVDDEVVARAALARQTFMDRLEGVSTKGMRRELAKLEDHLAMLARGKARVEAGIGTQSTTAQLEAMLNNLQYYYDSIEEVQERIQAIRRKTATAPAAGFSFFRKAESL